ncbi:MAG TPA: methyltransferase domain-containing protein [Elusimicrobiota bacterium]|nr:methyltransferase domain-containing protein [Elusimicrobiota bacterium]
MTILDFGCGPKKTPGAIGVDRFPAPTVDVVWDLDRHPYPFDTDSADRIVFSHILEHLNDPLLALQEACRISKPGGQIEVKTPHFSSLNAYSDLTHRHVLSVYAFIRLQAVDMSLRHESGPDQYRPSSRRSISLRLLSHQLTFWRLLDQWDLVPPRLLGIEWISNRYPIFYERFLAFLFPAQEISILYEVVK